MSLEGVFHVVNTLSISFISLICAHNSPYLSAPGSSSPVEPHVGGCCCCCSANNYYCIIIRRERKDARFSLSSRCMASRGTFLIQCTTNAELLQTEAHPFHFLNSSPLRQIVNFHKILMLILWNIKNYTIIYLQINDHIRVYSQGLLLVCAARIQLRYSICILCLNVISIRICILLYNRKILFIWK